MATPTARLHINRGDTVGIAATAMLDGRQIGRLVAGMNEFSIPIGPHVLRIDSARRSPSTNSSQTFRAKAAGNYHCSWKLGGDLTKPVDLFEIIRLSRRGSVQAAGTRPTAVGGSTSSGRAARPAPRGATAPVITKVAGIRATSRKSYPLAPQSYVIDNSSSPATITSRDEKSRQWTKTMAVDTSRIEATNKGFAVGPGLANIKASAERQVSRKYMLSAGTVETTRREIEVAVPPHTKLEVTLRWTQIVEYGVVRYADATGQVVLEVPYHVWVDITCDVLTTAIKSTKNKG